jgi:hypothetical protein
VGAARPALPAHPPAVNSWSTFFNGPRAITTDGKDSFTWIEEEDRHERVGKCLDLGTVNSHGRTPAVGRIIGDDCPQFKSNINAVTGTLGDS